MLTPSRASSCSGLPAASLLDMSFSFPAFTLLSSLFWKEVGLKYPGQPFLACFLPEP